MASPPEPTPDAAEPEDGAALVAVEEPSALRAAFELPSLLILAIVVALLIKAFLFQAFFIPSA